MSLLLESSLRREGNERAFLIQISRPKLFNSAELICSHGGECLKVRADLMHLVRCSALLALMGDPFVLVSHGSFCANFLVTHYSFQAIPANFDTHLRRLSAPASCLRILILNSHLHHKILFSFASFLGARTFARGPTCGSSGVLMYTRLLMTMIGFNRLRGLKGYGNNSRHGSTVRWLHGMVKRVT